MKVKINNIQFKKFYQKEKLKNYILVDVMAKLVFYKLPLALVVAIFDPIGWKIVLAVGILFGFYAIFYLLVSLIEIQT